MYAIKPQGINPENQVRFNGYRQADIDTINISDKDSIDRYINSNKEILEPDYVNGERTFLPFLLGTFKKTINVLSRDSIKDDARKIREGLDLIV